MNSISSLNFNINAFLYLVTFIESASRSGFYLNILHSFLVLSLRILDRVAISTSTTSNSCFWVICVRFALLRTRSANLFSFCYWLFSNLLISNPANSLLMSSWGLTKSRNFRLLIDYSMIVLTLKLSIKFISILLKMKQIHILYDYDVLNHTRSPLWLKS